MAQFTPPEEDTTPRSPRAAMFETAHHAIVSSEALQSIMRGRQPDFAQVLDVLAEAVTIRDGADHIIYANRAALDDMGFATLAELQSRAPGEIMSDYDVLDEFGRPLLMDDMPSVRLMRGDPAEPLLIRTVNRSSGALQWKLLKAAALCNDAGHTVATVMIIADVTESKNAELRSRFLAEASEMLGSSLDYAQTLQNVAWSVVPQLADWCTVDLVDEAGQREHVAVAHSDPEQLEIAERLQAYQPLEADPSSPLGGVLQTGRSAMYAEVPDEMLLEAAYDDEHLALLHKVMIRSALIVALRTPRRTLGAMTLVMSESGRTFTAADLEFAEQLAGRAAMAVENALLYRARAQIAATLQDSLRPERVPTIPGWEVATLYRPAGAESEIEVGGDFYDFVSLDDGWLVIIGDVTGKGLLAATLTSLARHCARFMSRIDPRPSAVLRAIDEALLAQGRLSLCSALCLRLCDDEIVFSSGGHPLPLVVGADGALREAGEPGMLLGIEGAHGWRDEELRLGDGETLVAFTDGVTDAHSADGRFGEERLHELLREHAGAPPGALLATLDAELDAFRAGPQADDTAAVALARRPRDI
jgi:serine phosphatase RsbU (regulator of sigma subunit)